MAKTKYWSSRRIREHKAKYNMIFGERSNGKTTEVYTIALEEYVRHGSQLGIIRRWEEDFVGRRGASMFTGLVQLGRVEKITGGAWTDIYYRASRWYLCRYEEDGRRIVSEEPWAYGFALTTEQHDKSTAYPKLRTILFDEFLSRSGYLPDEFVLFTSTLSTIIRDRDDVTIWMLGNTVNKFCPYFREMGLDHIKEMQPGDIDIYRYGDSELTVAVEYTASSKEGKASDSYFAFDNPKMQMIKSGAWELDVYPHCPIKYRPKDIRFTFFILFDGETLQCEVVSVDKKQFIFIHRKTSALQDPDHDLIFSPDYDPRPNWRRKITQPTTEIERKLAYFFRSDKVFYQDNDVGELVRNYLIFCAS